MADRADAANASGDTRHFLKPPALGKFFKATELGNMKLGIFHFTAIVEKNRDFGVAFDAGDWIDCNCSGHAVLLWVILFSRSGCR